MEDWLGVVALFAFMLCFLGGSIMMAKGRSFIAGFVMVFFLGIIGFVIVNCLSDVVERDSSDSYEADKNSSEKSKVYGETTLPINGWKCTCGKINESYVGTCSCGCDRYNSNTYESVQDTNKTEDTVKESDEEYQLNLLKKYKELFDVGAISEEEFYIQKKRIFGNIHIEENDEVEDEQINGWTCVKCQHKNPEDKKSCYYCGAIKDKEY